MSHVVTVESELGCALRNMFKDKGSILSESCHRADGVICLCDIHQVNLLTS